MNQFQIIIIYDVKTAKHGINIDGVLYRGTIKKQRSYPLKE